MTLTSSHARIAIRGTVYGQAFENIMWHRITGAAGALLVTPAQAAEAYWNNIKDAWRAAQSLNGEVQTTEIFYAEDGLAGGYGTYAIPSGEQLGTRTGIAANQVLPSFTAAGIKLEVASRVTRPGQKRIVGAGETDASANVWLAPYLALLAPLGHIFSDAHTLGAPAALVTVHPEIARTDPTTRVVSAAQDVTGFLVNGAPTTQVSRKIGRGI